jgi:hypothetical protein
MENDVLLSLAIESKEEFISLGLSKPKGYRFISPPPFKAMRGLWGMNMADKVLKKYGIVGILIGSLTRQLWRGISLGRLLKMKDVDVLIPEQFESVRPEVCESGIDWWISDGKNPPTNGLSDEGMFWTITLKERIEPGLYICPLEFVWLSLLRESQISGLNFSAAKQKFKKTPSESLRFPVLSKEKARFHF